MSTQNIISGLPWKVAATATVRPMGCELIGVLCSASSSGTLEIYDNTAATGTSVVGATPLVAGTFTSIPMTLQNGLHVVIGGTATVTFFTNK